MALSIVITDQELKETSGLLGGLDEVLWPGETDWEKIREEADRQVKNSLTQSGLDPADIADDDEALKYAIIYKALEVMFFGLIKNEGDTWQLRSEKANERYQENIRQAIITLTTGAEVRVGQGRAIR